MYKYFSKEITDTQLVGNRAKYFEMYDHLTTFIGKDGGIKTLKEAFEILEDRIFELTGGNKYASYQSFLNQRTKYARKILEQR